MPLKLNDIDNVYLLGIGGIGMSALARYFNANGKNVAGYDRNSSELTNELRHEGIDVHFEDDMEYVPFRYKNPENKDKNLIIYTPAVPEDSVELCYFKEKGFELKKRSQVLGMIAEQKICIAIAGTHGKTTVSTLTAHILKQSSYDCNAFLGGIAKNYNSNLLLSESSKFLVAEADEYDRSFLCLNPAIAIITSIDADHLDIYKDHNEIVNTFVKFTNRINDNGVLILKHGLKLDLEKNIKTFTYSLDNTAADFHITNLRIENGAYHFDFVAPELTIKNLRLGVPGLYNVENAVAALSIAYTLGVIKEIIRESLEKFTGVKRRFDVQLKKGGMIYIDDYAHHPAEISACIKSVREMYPGMKVTGIFQPHLYSRTRDFADEFAQSLSLLDELILLDIYPARELPIEGVSSEIIFNKVSCKEKIACSKDEVINILSGKKIELLVTMGAGDIDKLVNPITRLLNSRIE